jgi:hypothetical protein
VSKLFLRLQVGFLVLFLTMNFNCSIVAGVTSQIDPVLVLSGVTKMDDLRNFTYRPYVILEGVSEIPYNS